MEKSVTKTFEQQSDFGEVVEWVMAKIESTEREIPYCGAEPSLDVKIETNFKYRITVTKISNEKSDQTI